MTARTEAAGVAFALLVVADAAETLDREADGSAGLRDALATLQSRLLAADELREAAYAFALSQFAKSRHAALYDALAAYDKAGTT